MSEADNNSTIYINNSNSNTIEDNAVINDDSAIIISSPDNSPVRTSPIRINFTNIGQILALGQSALEGISSSASWNNSDSNVSSNEEGWRSSSSVLGGSSTNNSNGSGSNGIIGSESRSGSDSESRSSNNRAANAIPFSIQNLISNSQSDFIEALPKHKIIDNKTNSRENDNTNKRVKSEKEENDVCSICLERWGDSGPHQISSTKCGHLFGKSCILKWISSGHSDQSKCPTCNQITKRNDIRPLFVGNLAVKDQTELDKLERIIREKEYTINRINMDINSIRLSNIKANSQIGFLEDQLNVMRKRKYYDQANNNQLTEPNHGTISSFTMDIKYKLSNSTSMPTRSLAYIEEQDILLVGKQADLESQGVLAISNLSNPLKAQKTISLGHQSQIKNIKTFATPSGRVFSLSGGMDCNLIYRVHIKQGEKSQFIHTEILYTFKLQSKVFSCCFHPEDPNIFYAAGIGGTIYYFNLTKKSDGPQVVFKPDILKGPTIIFLDCLPQLGYLVVVTLKGVFLAKLTFEEQLIWSIEQLASGNVGIFSVSHIKNQIYLFSLRHIDGGFVEHKLAKFDYILTQSAQTNRYREEQGGEGGQSGGRVGVEYEYEFNTLHTFRNPGSQLNMTQTAAYQNPLDPSYLLIASPGQNENSVIIRTVAGYSSYTDTIPLPNSETVNHLAFIQVKGHSTNDEEEEEFYADSALTSPTTNSRPQPIEVDGEKEGENSTKPEPLITNSIEKTLISIRLLVLTNQSVYLYKIHYNQ